MRLVGILLVLTVGLLGALAVLAAGVAVARLLTRVFEAAVQRGELTFAGFLALVAGLYTGLIGFVFDSELTAAAAGGACAISTFFGAYAIRRWLWLGTLLYIGVPVSLLIAGVLAAGAPAVTDAVRALATGEWLAVLFFVLLHVAILAATFAVERTRRRRTAPVASGVSVRAPLLG